VKQITGDHQLLLVEQLNAVSETCSHLAIIIKAVFSGLLTGNAPVVVTFTDTKPCSTEHNLCYFAKFYYAVYGINPALLRYEINHQHDHHCHQKLHCTDSVISSNWAVYCIV